MIRLIARVGDRQLQVQEVPIAGDITYLCVGCIRLSDPSAHAFDHLPAGYGVQKAKEQTYLMLAGQLDDWSLLKCLIEQVRWREADEDEFIWPPAVATEKRAISTYSAFGPLLAESRY